MAEREIIDPIEQAEVSFYDKTILAVRLPDGRIAATLLSLVQALDLALSPQLRRIRTDEVLADQLLPVRVDTSGGPQKAEALSAWAIPTWLTGIRLGMLALEKRPTILAFKKEAADVLYRHFSQPHESSPALLEAPAVAAVVPAEAPSVPEKPTADASHDTWIDYYEQMIAYHRWQQDMEEWRTGIEDWQGHMESRLETVEEISRLVPEILERMGPQLLTPEHQHTVRSLVQRLSEAGGFHPQTIYTDLYDAFHVAQYQQIPEARWLDVAQWFRQRIAAAEKHQ